MGMDVNPLPGQHDRHQPYHPPTACKKKLPRRCLWRILGSRIALRLIHVQSCDRMVQIPPLRPIPGGTGDNVFGETNST
jgi:hypothetical protein